MLLEVRLIGVAEARLSGDVERGRGASLFGWLAKGTGEGKGEDSIRRRLLLKEDRKARGCQSRRGKASVVRSLLVEVFKPGMLSFTVSDLMLIRAGASFVAIDGHVRSH